MTDDATGETTDEQQTTTDHDGPGATLTRRAALTTLGLTGLLGLGVGSASADPQGQVGTNSDPLQALYTEKVTAQSGQSLVLNTDGGTKLLTLSVPKTPDGAAGNENVGNVVAGHPDNQTQNGAAGVVIAGGGNSNERNVAASHYMTIGGGFGHTTGGVGAADAAEYATIGGGRRNTVSADGATVGGGEGNDATNGAATIAGGNDNEASGSNASVGGGQQNIASGLNATVPGGQFNRATADASHAAGEFAAAESNDTFVFNDGSEHTSIPNSGADGLSSDTAVAGETVTGSQTFSASATNGFRFITGGATTPNVTYIDGSGNFVSSGRVDTDTVQSPSGSGLTFNTGGGDRALKLGVLGFDSSGAQAGGNVVAGHPNNTVNNDAVGVVIGGGGGTLAKGHTVGADYATVGGGRGNTANGKDATVSGGKRNTASREDATVAGGAENEASGSGAAVLGGTDNVASNTESIVVGASLCTASGKRSLATGSVAAAEDYRSFVWNDGSGYHSVPNTTDGLSSSTDVSGEPVTGADTFSVSAQGGVRFITGSSSVTYIDGGTTGWATTSTRTAKTNIDPVDPERILDGVTEMEVATWEYTDDDGAGQGVTHVGPMAEDFHEVVDVGTSDDHINSVNADGVAFAAIQGLAERLERKDERIDELEAETEQFRAEADDLREETEQLRAENDRLRERNGELESRLERIESELGIEEQAVADD